MTAVNIALTPRRIDPSVDHEIHGIVSGSLQGETCNTDLVEAPWLFDTVPGYGPGASEGDVIPTGAPRQGELPREYREATEAELHATVFPHPTMSEAMHESALDAYGLVLHA